MLLPPLRSRKCCQFLSNFSESCQIPNRKGGSHQDGTSTYGRGCLVSCYCDECRPHQRKENKPMLGVWPEVDDPAGLRRRDPPPRVTRRRAQALRTKSSLTSYQTSPRLNSSLVAILCRALLTKRRRFVTTTDVPLLRDQLPVPTQDGVRSKSGRDRVQAHAGAVPCP